MASDASPFVSAIVLAAGLARRFGGGKLTALVNGEPLIHRTVTGLQRAAVGETIVVVSADAEAVRGALQGLDVRVVVNDRHAEGMSTSLVAGVRAARDGSGGFLIVLGDQPGVDERVVAPLVAALATGAPIAVPRYRGGRGNPVLFSGALREELCAIEGDVGGREVVRRDPGRVVEVPIDVEEPRDVDTVEDLARISRENL